MTSVNGNHAATPPERVYFRKCREIWTHAHLQTKLCCWAASDDLTTRVIFSIWSVHLITILQAGGAALATAVALGALVGSAQVRARAVEMTIGRYYHPI